jgi:hypothetical protein
MRPSPLTRRTPLGLGARSLERKSTFAAEPRASKRRPISPASPQQRGKVKTHVCVVCQADHCDPAHLAPRSMARGCDEADCVIALCRAHHTLFDSGELDLLPHLSNRGFARRVGAHAVALRRPAEPNPTALR